MKYKNTKISRHREESKPSPRLSGTAHIAKTEASTLQSPLTSDLATDRNKIETPGLYIVSTPIGNLEDITIRALNTLKSSSIILCEDTRNTGKLLAKHNIRSKLIVYNDHSTDKQRTLVTKLIDEGAIISLVSDAGTPLISDPGFKLIKDLKSSGYFVEVIPGVSAPIAALTLSTLPTDRFLFAGFLPKTTIKKQKTFEELSKISATLIFFETAIRLIDSLNCAISVLGNREACVARELTKLYQEVTTTSLQELVEYYTTHTLKGEIVLLISGMNSISDKLTLTDAQKTLKSYLNCGHTKKSAAELFIKECGDCYSKNELYKMMNEYD